MSNPYTHGQEIIKNISDAWVAQDDSFFFRVYFEAPSVPVATIVPAGFDQGSGQGYVITDAGVLTTDAKLLIAFVIDDTSSIKWSDPGGLRTTEIPNMITALWDHTPATVSAQPYSISYGDFWTFADGELERSLGFINDLVSLQTFGAALFGVGFSSSLYDTSPIALSGLTQQSIVDAILQPNDPTNVTRVANLVLYLQSRSILRLSNVIAYWNALPMSIQSAWGLPDGGNYQADTICNYDDVSTFVVSQWAQSFTPLGIIISDGDDNGIGTPENVAATANSAWGDNGVPVFTFALGHSHTEHGLRTIATLTHGKCFDISIDNIEDDWILATNSLLHGGDNSLFKANWSRIFDYESAVWISKVSTTYTSPSNGSSVSVQVRWTYDRVNWTSWYSLTSGVDLDIEELVLAFEYKVDLVDGWDSFTLLPDRPEISVLQHTVVTPSVQYLITPPQNVNGMLFETLLSATADLPRSARANWGVVRGNSIDFADFEIVHNERKSALPNRQQSLQFTPEIVRPLLKTTTTNNQAYQVFDGLKPAKWTASDIVQVYAGGVLVSPNAAAYSLDGTLGIVYFAVVEPANLVVQVTITTPQKLYTSIGEPTTTRDNRTYYLVNGRWPYDAIVIVLINGVIKRGGYWTNPPEGTVTFFKELEPTDLVTVFVQFSGVYRVGVELLNYNAASSVTVDNFGLYFNTLSNGGLLAQYNSPLAPSILGNIVTLSPDRATIYQRMTISYKFVSVGGSEEQGTQTTWWRYRPSEDTSGYTNKQVIGGFTYVQITAVNGFWEYNNRITEREADVGSAGLFHQGDQVFVTVSPSDGFNTGLTITSPIMIMRGNKIPYVDTSTLLIVSPRLVINGDGIATCPAGDPLTATYVYHNPDNIPDTTPDNSIIEWYIKDSSQVEVNGKVVSAGITLTGQVWNFKVTPYNGQVEGVPVFSGNVTIT